MKYTIVAAGIISTALYSQPALSQIRNNCVIDKVQYDQAFSIARRAIEYGAKIEAIDSMKKKQKTDLRARICDVSSEWKAHSTTYSLRETITIDNQKECSSLLGFLDGEGAKILDIADKMHDGKITKQLLLSRDGIKLLYLNSAKEYMENNCK